MNFINNQILPPDPGIGSYTSDLIVMANVHGQDAIIAVRMKSGDRDAVSSAEESAGARASAREGLANAIVCPNNSVDNLAGSDRVYFGCGEAGKSWVYSIRRDSSFLFNAPIV